VSKYEYYEELEEEAFREVVETKKKPKKQKKSWNHQDSKQKDIKRDKKNSWSNHPDRI
tara:strand:+ start:12492 stop:12665 length:174 start_codon:yes stop_codon:yes gene_type:complete